MQRSWTTAWSVGAACALLAAGLGGCTALTDADGSTPSPASSSQTSEPVTKSSGLIWSDGSLLISRLHTVDAARPAVPGEDYVEYLNTGSLPAGELMLQTLGLESNGNLVTMMGTAAGDELEGGGGRMLVNGSLRVGRHTPEGFIPFTVAGKPGTNYGPNAVDRAFVGDEGILWSEVPMEDGNGQWKILGVSPGSTEVRVLAESEGKAPALEPGSNVAPILSDGRVYWSLSLAGPGDEAVPERAMYSVDFENPGRPSTEAPGLFSPFPGPGGVVAEKVNPGNTGYPKPGALVSFSSGREPEELLRATSTDFGSVEILGSDQKSLSLLSSGELHLVDLEQRTGQTFAKPLDSSVTRLVHCKDSISWSYDHSTPKPLNPRYVYNRETSEVIAIRDPGLLSTGYCAGDFMAWSSATGSSTGQDFRTVVTKWNHQAEPGA